MLRYVLIFAIALLGLDDGTKKGRQGNKQYKAEAYAEAAGTYRAALQEANTDAPGKTVSALYNNMGSALHKEKKFEEAAPAFTEALRTASTDEDRSRAAFNAGNNAFQAQNTQAALEYYRQSLLADPENEEARYNYEFVQRQMQQQQNQKGQQQQQDQPNNEGQKDQPQDPQQDQQQPEQDQQQDQPQPDESQEGEDQQQPPPQNPNQMSKEQAERILQAMQTDEKELLKDVRRMKGPKRNVEKDW